MLIMARKKGEADVQVYIKTEEEWEKLIESQVVKMTESRPESLTQTMLN